MDHFLIACVGTMFFCMSLCLFSSSLGALTHLWTSQSDEESTLWCLYELQWPCTKIHCKLSRSFTFCRSKVKWNSVSTGHFQQQNDSSLSLSLSEKQFSLSPSASDICGCSGGERLVSSKVEVKWFAELSLRFWRHTISVTSWSMWPECKQCDSGWFWIQYPIDFIHRWVKWNLSWSHNKSCRSSET